MSITEDRLIAALAARADQVQPEDLRAPEVPEAAPAVTFLRRPAAYAVGIAAAAAAIAAPFVVGGLGSDDAPPPPATNSPSPTLEPQPDIGGNWPVTQRLKVDLDGDGTPEQVRVAPTATTTPPRASGSRPISAAPVLRSSGSSTAESSATT